MGNENKLVSNIILAAMFILIASVLTGVLAGLINTATSYSKVTETVSLAPARLPGANTINESYHFHLSQLSVGYRQSNPECSDAKLVDSNLIDAYNASGSAYTMNGCGSGGDFYLVDTDNTITFCNSAVTNRSNSNVTSFKYSVCPDGYVSSWGQTITKIALGMIALLVLGGIIYYLYMVYKEHS